MDDRRAYQRQYHKERAITLRAAGLCKDCKSPAAPGKSRCERCLKRGNEREKIRYSEKRVILSASGICVVCEINNTSGSLSCKSCISRIVDSGRERQRRRKSSGICRICGKRTATHGLSCNQCWYRCMSVKVFGTVHMHERLRELWDAQGGICRYTGEVLIQSETASIDHIIPKSRGGTNDMDNLQWVSKKINSMKSSMTHEEFCEVIRRIHDHTLSGTSTALGRPSLVT